MCTSPMLISVFVDTILVVSSFFEKSLLAKTGRAPKFVMHVVDEKVWELGRGSPSMDI